MKKKDDRRGWHVGREIPLALIVTLILQTGFFVRWLSKLESSVEQTAITQADMKGSLSTLAALANSPQPAVNAANISKLEKDLAVLRSDLDFVRREQAARTPFIPRAPQR